MQAPVQVCQHGSLTANRPGPLAQDVHHRGAVDPLHEELGTVLADLFHSGDRISMTAHIFHGLCLGHHRPTAASAAQDEPGPAFEDVGIPARCQQGSGRPHLGKGS